MLHKQINAASILLTKAQGPSEDADREFQYLLPFVLK